MKKAGLIIYAIPMAVFGIIHFANGSAMTGMVPSWLPAPIFWVYLVGLGLLAASASIIINKKASLATMLLGAMLVIFVLTMHIPGVIGGNEASMPMLLKDLALAGAAFYMSANLKEEEG
jgi:uncharacterized membrane protein